MAPFRDIVRKVKKEVVFPTIVCSHTSIDLNKVIRTGRKVVQVEVAVVVSGYASVRVDHVVKVVCYESFVVKDEDIATI